MTTASVTRAAAGRGSAAAISVTMGSKKYHEMNDRTGDVGNRIDFVFVFQSALEKDVRALKGTVVIKDLFDQLIMRLTLSHEAGLPAGGKAEWRGGIKYN